MVMDMTGYLRRVMNAGVAETFDQATDSLEAIRDFIAAMMGFGPGVSLWMFGRCAAGMAASLTVITTDNLGAALPNDVFNNEFYITVVHNASAPGTAPEGEWRRISDFVGATQTFTTDAFTVNVEASDLLLIVHESILFGQPLARGTLDASSATVPADSTRTEGDNYFRGHLFMATEGAARFQPRLIVAYTGVGGIFTLDPNNPLTIAPGLVDYVVLPYQSQFVPAADAAINRTPADVIGNKTDTNAGTSLLARQLVPGADAVTNVNARDVIGQKASTPIYTPDDVSDIIRYLKGLLNTLNMGERPSIHLYEGWQDEAGIDSTVWTVTNPATGTAWARAADGADLMASSIPNANETARIRSNQRWVVAPTLYGTNKILRRFILEFEMQLASVANLDNTLCFLGLTPAVGNDRSSANIIGFTLLADVLQTLTDLAGVETTNTGFGETLTNKNKFRIEILLNTVRFYLNETLIATHAATLPDLPMYLNFFVDTEAGGAATIKLGIARAWFEDIPR